MRKGDLSTGPMIIVFIVGALVVLLLLISVQQGLFHKIPDPLYELIDKVLGEV
ncbi:MAG: hypothetical protein ABEI07_00130 [Candidatus Nanohaloarchaea archaeon]